MRYTTLKLKSAIIFIACSSWSGCNYEFRETPRAEQANQNASNQSNRSGDTGGAGNTGSAAPTPAKYETGGAKLVLNETSQTATIPCQNREVEVAEEAVGNNYVLSGECKKLTVNGVSNRVTVEKVGEIAAAGVSNKVYYGEGSGGKKPKISKSGTSTFVETIQSQQQANANK